MFYREILNDQHNRYRSWEHCCCQFRTDKSSNDKDFDILALHLAFYLASWGMYRGSSQLLQKDYKVHLPIVHEIMSERYNVLWNMTFDNPDEDAEKINLVLELAKILRQIYMSMEVSPTDTLVTKVMLGTFGCIPAYDTLFVNGITFWNGLPGMYKPKFPARLGVNNYRGLINFYREHKIEIGEAHDFVARQGVHYPIMKLVDMYFWSLGYQFGR